MKKLDKVYKNVDEMKAAGFTDQDLNELKNAPRSKNEDFEHGHTWFPEVNGFRIPYTCWNQQERDHYNAFKKNKTPGTKHATVTKNQELIDHLLSLKDDKGLYLYYKAIGAPEAKIYEQFGSFNPTKITAADLIALLG